MRAMFGLAAAAVAFAGCATMNVASHIERGIDFTQYRTYEWGPKDSLPVGDPRLDNNPFFNDYLQGAVEKRLAAKGYERAAIGEPADLLIHYHASVNQRFEVYTRDQEQGYCYGNCEPQVNTYEEGTLVVDVVDARTKKVVWRGWAQDTMAGVIDRQDRLEKQVDEGVAKMMTLLPRCRALGTAPSR